MTTGELFDPGPPQPKPQRPKSAPSVAFGKCPKCIAHDRVGMVRTTTHLIWREHRFTTWAGIKMTCPASLAPICQAHDRNKPRHKCVCERPLSARQQEG